MKRLPASVTMCTPSTTGGHARYTRELLSAISRAGAPELRVSLVTSADLDVRNSAAPYRIHRVLPPLAHRSSYNRALTWAVMRLRHYLRRERALLTWAAAHRDECEGLHFQEYTPWLAPQHFRRLKARGHRLYMTVHNLYPHRYLPRRARRLYSAWMRLAWRRCDGLFVHTDDLRDRLAELLGAGHPPIFVTPHGVWTASVGDDSPVPTGDRLASRRLLFFGVVRRNKGLPVLLRAMEQLEDCTLTVAGAFEEPRYREEIRQLVSRLPPGRVELLDRFVDEDELGALFARSTLTVLPYTSFAAQSGVLHDALAYGVPVVVTEVGTLGDSVRRWGIGEVAPPDDEDALAAGVRAMLEPQRYTDAVSAVERTRDTLSWERTAELTIDAYQRTGLGGVRAASG